MKKVKCAVLGATGVVGQHFLKLLNGHPYFELGAVCASEARTGKTLGEMKEHIDGGIPQAFADLVFDPIDVDILMEKEIKVIFSALPADIADTIEKKAAKEGMKVFSNASSYRMDKNVPILIPEVNHEHIGLTKAQSDTEGFIITNANCTTTGLTMALLPIIPMGIKRLVVASYQAISGAGYPGLSAMDIQGNVIPYIGNEEPKLLSETKKICGTFNDSHILDADWEIHAHCIRVPAIVGHLISVHAEMENDMEYDKVLSAFQNYKSPEQVAGLPTAPEQAVIYRTEIDRPQHRYDVKAGSPERAAGMAVSVGRLQVEGNIIRFVTLSNNLVRGAAGGSILNAEMAYRQGLL